MSRFRASYEIALFFQKSADEILPFAVGSIMTMISLGMMLAVRNQTAAEASESSQ